VSCGWRISLIAMLFAACTAQSASPENDLVGAWLIVETAIRVGDSVSVNQGPQPGIYVFTDEHFSNMLVQGAEPREPFSASTTPELRLAAYDRFIADAGSYELTDSTLTTRNLIAKVPNVMNDGFAYRYTLEGDSLWLTFSDGWAPEGGEITYTLVRLE